MDSDKLVPFNFLFKPFSRQYLPFANDNLSLTKSLTDKHALFGFTFLKPFNDDGFTSLKWSIQTDWWL